MRFSAYPAALAAFTAALASPATAQDQSLLLRPTSDWVLQYGEENCSLIRLFGEGEDQMRLQIDNYGSPANYWFQLSGPYIPQARRVVGTVDTGFSNEAEPQEVEVLNGNLGEHNSIIFSRPLLSAERIEDLLEHADAGIGPWLEPDHDFETAATVLEFHFRNSTVALRLGSMAPPMDALRACRSNLVEYWGLDPEIEATLSRRAAFEASAVRRVQADYPSSMARSGRSGYVNIRIMVDAEGNQQGCTVQTPQADAEFRDAACENLSRGLRPALDADGNPVGGAITIRVIYIRR